MKCVYFPARALAALSFMALAAPGLRAGFIQTNLASDVTGLAANFDPNLKNPWGMSFSATSPFWVSNQGSDNSTLYTGTGAPQALIVTVPPTTGVPTGPTGQVFNSTTAFVEKDGSAASFIFDTLAGTIDAWNSGNGIPVGTAEQEASATGSYTGLAIDATTERLYAANFATGNIDVYNSSFGSTMVSGGFVDPNAMAGYAPYNIQEINGLLYVEYDEVNAMGRPQAGNGLGYVDVFDTNGVLQKRLITGGALDAPWGITLAPAGFGNFGGDLLVGNFGNGEINAFNATSGAFVGTITDNSGNPIVNDGLWALDFRTGGAGVNPNALYFTAGINGEADGLFGSIATPEPGTWALGLAALTLLRYVRRRSRR